MQQKCYSWQVVKIIYKHLCIITARGYAKRGICHRRVSVCLCVCHTPVLYQNGYT